MSRKLRFELRPRQMILAIALMVIGAAALIVLIQVPSLKGKPLTSLALLLSGLVFYSGILFIIGMFENETILSISLLLPSMIAVAIFVYGFIAWSVRVSLSKWKGLNPDYTWVGLKQYINLF